MAISLVILHCRCDHETETESKQIKWTEASPCVDTKAFKTDVYHTCSQSDPNLSA